MRIGDIIINPWVDKMYDGDLNPMYATIYLGHNTSLDYKGTKHRWNTAVFKEDPRYKSPWKVIGHIDLKFMLKMIIAKDEHELAGKRTDQIIIDEAFSTDCAWK